MGAYPDLSPAPPQAGYPPAALAPGGNDVLSWIRDEDRDAMKLGSFSPAAHGDLAALTGAAGGRGAEADGAGAGVGPGGWGGGGGSGAGGGSGVGASASSIPPESPHRAAAPIRVVVAQPFRIPPPVRLPPPPAPCPALQAAERKAAGMAAGSDDAFEKAAIDLADQELPTFLDSADADPRSAEITRLAASGLTARQAALSILVAGPGVVERPQEAAEVTSRIAGLEAVGFPESRVLGALVRFNLDPQAAADACLQSADVPV